MMAMSEIQCLAEAVSERVKAVVKLKAEVFMSSFGGRHRVEDV